jgi:hypothetical protein
MSSRRTLNSLSILCLAVFCLLATGSMEDSNNRQASGPVSTYDSPSLDSKQNVIRDIKLKYTWSTDGVIMKGNFKIDNPTDHAFKDFEITCDHYAPSGTKIDSNTRTIYETVKAKGKKSVNNFNMGFINSQASSSSCHVTNLVLID